MLHRSTQLALALCLSLLATGCKVALTVTSGGDVTSLSGANDCAGGSLCEYEVTDTNFSETFTAVPRAGYVFSKWQGGAGYLCAESTNPTCTLSNAPVEERPEAQRDLADTVIASGVYYYVQPLFTFVGIDTDEDGTKDYIDPDDDNDGVLDADDNCPLEGPNLDGFGCPVAPTKTVFVTSELYTGNLGGLAGADQKCNSLAATAGLSGTYMAWLSIGDYLALASPSTRFTRSTVPYALVDGTVIADDWDDLVDGVLALPIYLTESATDLPNRGVWTGTSPSGTPFSTRCGDWTQGDAFFTGRLGSTGTFRAGWTSSERASCGQGAHLYCFEQ